MTGSHEQERLTKRRTFDEAADRYDRTRPGYPPDLFDDLAALGDLQSGARVLEIGCGTGQATRELARRGYAIVAIDVGENLARLARRNLGEFPDVEIVVADFDTWELPRTPFDAIVAATAFHWLDPATRLSRCAEVLRPGGSLCVIDTDHVAGGTEQFWIDVQDCYRRLDPDAGFRLPAANMALRPPEELLVGGHFAAVQCRQYLTDVTYRASDYIELLTTYSDHLALPHEGLEALLGCVRVLIESLYGGSVTKRYQFTLRVARKPPSAAASHSLTT
ncbi:MAG: class I SAM-dependent methyltransferase [Chloroflexi bacterium]|nr:class I SAM-dependent methyltransferase [Chloroflexota bacterium]